MYHTLNGVKMVIYLLFTKEGGGWCSHCEVENSKSNRPLARKNFKLENLPPITGCLHEEDLALD